MENQSPDQVKITRAVWELKNLQRMAQLAIDNLMSGDNLKPMTETEREHPGAICCIGPYAVYPRFSGMVCPHNYRFVTVPKQP